MTISKLHIFDKKKNSKLVVLTSTTLSINIGGHSQALARDERSELIAEEVGHEMIAAIGPGGGRPPASTNPGFVSSRLVLSLRYLCYNHFHFEAVLRLPFTIPFHSLSTTHTPLLPLNVPPLMISSFYLSHSNKYPSDNLLANVRYI